MYCPNCKSANVLYNEDFDEYYCLVCNYYFALEIPIEGELQQNSVVKDLLTTADDGKAEAGPESPEQDEERHELELLIL